MTFAAVKIVLDTALANFANANGAPADLSGHASAGHPAFSWNTAAELRGAWGKNVPLIQPEVVGKTPKLGQTANLVVDLKTGLGGKPRMPLGGPYVSDQDIQTIIDWIDAGCPD